MFYLTQPWGFLLQEYEDLAAQDMARYEQEQKAVFNLDVSHKPRTPTTTTTP